MINNSSLPETKGTVNGIGQSLVAIFRSVGPTVGSLGLAWSEGNGELYLLHSCKISLSLSSGLSWPLNYHLMFQIIVTLALGIVLFSLLLPKTIEKKRQQDTTR